MENIKDQKYNDLQNSIDNYQQFYPTEEDHKIDLE